MASEADFAREGDHMVMGLLRKTAELSLRVSFIPVQQEIVANGAVNPFLPTTQHTGSLAAKTAFHTSPSRRSPELSILRLSSVGRSTTGPKWRGSSGQTTDPEHLQTAGRRGGAEEYWAGPGQGKRRGSKGPRGPPQLVRKQGGWRKRRRRKILLPGPGAGKLAAQDRAARLQGRANGVGEDSKPWWVTGTRTPCI